MTVWTNWCWWTYFVVDDDVVTRGCIISYDLARRRVTYFKRTANSYETNPHPRGSPEHDAWLYDTVEAPFRHVWVDPKRRSVLDRADYDLVESRQKPPSFVELTDGDPRAYFEGATGVLATYLPDSLLVPPPGEPEPDK